MHRVVAAVIVTFGVGLPEAWAAPLTGRYAEARRGAVAEALRNVLGAEAPWIDNLPKLPVLTPYLDRKAGRSAAVRSFIKRELQTAEAEVPLTELTGHSLGDVAAYRAERLIALRMFHRDRADISEGFVRAGRSQFHVPGEDAVIAARDIYYEHWRPPAGARPTGIVWVISPQYNRSGRLFYEQINALNHLGDNVLVMDHQWKGHSSNGSPGTIDRGLGLARDVAAVATLAQGVASHLYGTSGRVLIFGKSLGAGAGAWGAAKLFSSDVPFDLSLSGAAEGLDLAALRTPLRTDVALVAPHFEPANTWLTASIRLFGAVGAALGTGVALPQYRPIAPGHDPVERWERAQSRREPSKMRPEALIVTSKDVETLAALPMKRPFRAVVRQSEADKLSNTQRTREILAPLGDGLTLEETPGSRHRTTSADVMAFMLQARERLLAGQDDGS